jgi:hypothetical protein
MGINVCLENLKTKDQFQYPGGDRIILKLILNKRGKEWIHVVHDRDW